MKTDTKTVNVTVSDEGVYEQVVSVLQDERLGYKTPREESPSVPTDCDTAFVLVEGAVEADCIGLAQMLAQEIKDVVYCGPNHPHEKACIGRKIERLKKDATVYVRLARSHRAAWPDEPIELHVTAVTADK